MTILKQAASFMLALLLATPAFAQDLTPEAPPPSDNAAVWYLTASTLWHARGFDAETSELIQTYNEADLDKAGPVIDRLGAILYYVREGSKREKCSWAVDLDLGPLALLPHPIHLRTLTRVLAVSAQVRLARGDAAGAIEDCLTIMRMAPHAAADGTVVSNMMQASMEVVGVETLGKRLDALDREHLEQLRQGLAGLNERQPIWKALANDRLYVAWLRRQYETKGVEGFRDSGLWSKDRVPREIEALEGSDRADQTVADWLDELDRTYNRIIEVAKLPPAEFEPQAAKLEKQINESENPLVRGVVGDIGAVRRVELRTLSIRAMLDAMIAYRLGGEQAFRQVADPYDGRPFDFEVTDAGVVLSSRQIYHDDQRVSLTFSAGCAGPLD